MVGPRAATMVEQMVDQSAVHWADQMVGYWVASRADPKAGSMVEW